MVYLAADRELGTEIAVKVLTPDQANSKLVERLALEGRALESLSHPNIVRVLDFGATRDGSSFLALELLRGATLAEELRTEPSPPLERVLLDVGQILNGLGAAHGLGLVHRDIKPSNVFAHRDAGDARVIKLLDFGVVKVLGSSVGLTTAGVAIGTPRYMSPEQASGEAIDARSDLYSTALVLYRLVAGRGPFDHHRTTQDVLVARQLETPPAPSAIARSPVPRLLDDVILKGLERDPKDRFQSAAEFARALAEIAPVLGGEALRLAFSTSARWVLSERTQPTMVKAPPPPAQNTETRELGRARRIDLRQLALPPVPEKKQSSNE